jgi:hypothetical protein
MTPVVWMIALSVISWAAVSVIAPVPVNPEALFGMAGPLASAVATWVVTERVHRSNPERVTGVLIAGFAAKLVFFGVYLALMLRVVGLRPIPFAVGFTGYLIGLYMIEALFLKRLFGGGMRSPSA